MHINEKKKKSLSLNLLKEFIKWFINFFLGFVGIYVLSTVGMNLVYVPVIEYLATLNDSFVAINSYRAIIEILFSSVPTIYILNAKYKWDKISDETIEKISEENEMIEKEIREIPVDKRLEELEKQKPCIENIITRFETLSRKKQMELLNYIKGDEMLGCMDTEIDSLSEDGRNLLQTQLEDIMFPDFVEEEKDGYIRKRNFSIRMKNIF